MIKFFDLEGELNAETISDVIKQTTKYLKLLEEMEDSLIDSCLEEPTAEIQEMLALVFTQGIRRANDLNVARRLLIVDPLQPGIKLPPTYDAAPDYTIVTVPGNGLSPVVQSPFGADMVEVPTFKIESTASVEIDDYQKSKNKAEILNKMRLKMLKEIKAQEQANVFMALIEAGSKGENSTQDLEEPGDRKGKISRAGMLNLKRKVDRWSLITSSYVMNPDRLEDILGWKTTIDPKTKREDIQEGNVGMLFGADIFISPIMPPDEVIAVAEPEYVGVLPIENEFVVTSEKLKQWTEKLPEDDELKRIHMEGVEKIGVCIINTRGVSHGRI